MTKQRSILVTGASSGIGAYCVHALANEGWRVFATARNQEDIKVLEAAGISCLYMDYCEPESIARVADEIIQKTGGGLDALFNNGAYAQAGAVEDLPVEALRAQFEANFFGWHDLTRRLIPVMRHQGHGRIINCSSILGLIPVNYRGAYAASKHALEGLTLCMREELKGSGIQVSLIEPGPVVSKIATNGLPWFLKFIDLENSVHAHAYKKQLQRLEAGGTKSMFKPGPEAVYKALHHALNAKRARPHYVVTVPARAGVFLKRILPTSLVYRITAGQG